MFNLPKCKDQFQNISTVLKEFKENFKISVSLQKKINMEALIKTNKGDMRVSLYTEDAPNTVANFVKLAKEGFYNGLKWHREIGRAHV